MKRGESRLAIVLVVVLSTQVFAVFSARPVEKCLDGHHKVFPSSEKGSGFVACFPWKSRACCTAETTKDLKENEMMGLNHIDWEYCGNLSKSCREQMMRSSCWYFCDPNLSKWRPAAAGEFVEGAPICSQTCDDWFEACKNDKTYSVNWENEYIRHHFDKGPVTPNRSCRTFKEIFQNGEGLCDKIWGPSMKYEKSSNCMVFNFKGKNPNDNVVPS